METSFRKMDSLCLWSLMCILGSLTFLQASESSGLRRTRQTSSEDNEQFSQERFYFDTRSRRANSDDNNRRARQATFENSHAALSSTGIGPSFRQKRDQNEMNTHAIKSETDSLAAAAEGVAAEINSVAAAIEVEEARQSIVNHEDTHGKADGQNDEKEAKGGSEKESVSSEHKESESSLGTDHQEPKNENAIATSLPSALDPERDSHLKKLMSESSELAKELRMVFDILAKRESQLVEEMEHLKAALTGAVAVLKKSDESKEHNDNGARRFRRDHSTAEAPYRACVYIEASQDGGSFGNNYDHLGRFGESKGGELGNTGNRRNEQDYPPEPIIREFIPSDPKSSMVRGGAGGRQDNVDSDIANNNIDTNQPETSALVQENENSSSLVEDVDLSKVYWLKLPKTVDDESVRKKVHAVFSEVTGQGKDAIIIPVSRGFMSSEEVSRGFLKAVRVKPSALRSRYFRKLRSLNIREVH